jgi:hypothetical protein
LIFTNFSCDIFRISNGFIFQRLAQIVNEASCIPGEITAKHLEFHTSEAFKIFNHRAKYAVSV